MKRLALAFFLSIAFFVSLSPPNSYASGPLGDVVRFDCEVIIVKTHNPAPYGYVFVSVKHNGRWERERLTPVFSDIYYASQLDWAETGEYQIKRIRVSSSDASWIGPQTTVFCGTDTTGPR